MGNSHVEATRKVSMIRRHLLRSSVALCCDALVLSSLSVNTTSFVSATNSVSIQPDASVVLLFPASPNLCLMPVSKRKSLALAANDDPQSSAQDVTEILNELASNTPHTPSRKRPRPSDVSDNSKGLPNKMLVVELPHPSSTHSTPGVPSPRRASGRLKARTSLPARTPASRRTQWEVPEDAGENVGQGRMMEPVKKMIPLAKPKPPEKSPFKGKGTIQTKSSARVNLDDSPAKPNKTKDLSKVAKSLQRAGRPAKRKLERVKNTANKSVVTSRRSARLSMLTGDPFEEAQREEDDPLTPGLGLGQPPPQHRSQPEFSPLKAARKAASRGDQRVPISGQDENAESSDENSVPLPDGEDGVVPEPVSTQVEAAPEDEDVADEIAEETNVNEHGEPQEQDEEYTEIRVPHPSPPSRPDTEAEKRAKELEQAEEEEARRQAKEIALRGIEEAVEFSDLKEPWIELLVGVARIVEVRSTSQPESTRGKGVQRKIVRLAKMYSMLRDQDSSSTASLLQMVVEDMKVLKERCADIDGHKEAKEPGEPDYLKRSERNKTIHDVYEHLIPGMVKLAKMVLKTRFVDNDLSIDAHKELFQLLKIAQTLVTTARTWDPRPKLENGIKSLAIHSIDINVGTIICRYEDVIIRENARLFSEKLYLKQLADLERLKWLKQKKNADIRARHRQQLEEDLAQYEKEKRQRERWSAGQGVIDIDDIDGIFSGDLANPAYGYRQNSITHRFNQASSQLSRPMVKRQPTEDIPAPSQYTWTEDETQVLVNALQRFTDVSRFEDIVEVYCGPHGKLRNFDMDQIMTQARWLKQSMATLLADKSPSDPGWAWLIAVPSEP